MGEWVGGFRLIWRQAGRQTGRKAGRQECSQGGWGVGGRLGEVSSGVWDG